LACQQLGGTLVEIGSVSENTFIAGSIKNKQGKIFFSIKQRFVDFNTSFFFQIKLLTLYRLTEYLSGQHAMIKIPVSLYLPVYPTLPFRIVIKESWLF
jgi:hypothetical protein